jgi:hypothetical protein
MSGCPVCPVVIDAGSSASLNVSWVSSDPAAAGLSETFVNISINSPYPFYEGAPSASHLVYATSYMWTAGGPGGFVGDDLTFVIPYSYSNLPATGTIDVVMNASAVR